VRGARITRPERAACDRVRLGLARRLLAFVVAVFATEVIAC
jgi:hypothetical protein